ncbi:hypothetical protein Rvan_1395 [Rhodomicrobium vannielii ATCC 17100]|uniref:N-acetyltransferase domain-containing protein n=1 Tax=Rhodomicrobium vannielii (strain ATCC 17100 / DSM 162 / LMG 4299 / NCIMB 10020 / ATH 3.1.1) TaxID=648757 RepID=E3I6K7_RHOVT|nr:hypothetical protein [Rhodomicrobium vannielii]ADP70654.1 hypothetical protein Rvan_1395 [Rhodomicrobium vannielii ATCC 17100]
MHIDSPLVLDRYEARIEEFDRLFIDASLAQVHPLIRSWGADATEVELHETQRNAIRALVESGERMARASRHRLSLPISRLIEIEGHRLIATLNMQNAADERPFICLFRSTIPPGTIPDWSRLKRRLLHRFAAFEPRAVLFFHPSHLPLIAETAGIDDHLLAAPAREIAGMPKAVGSERVFLKRSTSLAFYPRYKAVYEATYVERPELRGEVRTETEGSLAYCLRRGFLFEIFVDGKWAGVVAAKWRTLVGIRGVFMVEIVLAGDVRGQRLGPAVHQLFAEAVAQAEPGAVIIGTISAKNPWSLKAALRAGRIEIGAWHWVDL